MLEDGVPALDIIIATVDGERDPRCLLLAFNCIQLIVKLHLQIGSSFIRVTPQPRSAVECTSCCRPGIMHMIYGHSIALKCLSSTHCKSVSLARASPLPCCAKCLDGNHISAEVTTCELCRWSHQHGMSGCWGPALHVPSASTRLMMLSL